MNSFNSPPTITHLSGGHVSVAHPRIKEALTRLSSSLHGKDDALVKVLACIFSNGHLLLEDLPGLGKTTVAIAVARMLGLNFGRIQCTNDLLPTDITGLNIFKAEKGEFEFHPGPIFNHLVLVDEINRATPKTQSALLEAMGEEQATIDGKTYRLSRPFFVVATQNPVEHSGTFPLPESQMDRFMMRVSIGYPPRDAEREILRVGSQREELSNIPPLFSPDEILRIQGEIGKNVKVSEKILDYMLNLTEKTRSDPNIAAGISTRGAMSLLQLSKTLAWMQNRDYVIPEDVKSLAEDVLLHRLQLRQGSEATKREILRAIFSEVPALP
ncbi:MAG: MoxR family ATPase [Synergistaceae bacterium]|jgi:MoxR-like ATPase|nr:MoxR family ATPase [Synergistaceae bacterium]